MSDIAIKVENLSKRYRIGAAEIQHDTFLSAIGSWMKSPASNYHKLRRLSSFSENGSEEDVIWALKDVSFEVKQGEVIGVIGHNGAGKSTLLKVLSRITAPTEGRIELNGRVASLLEVGTGFHPELTGRENIYLNGTILGMTKVEVDRKFDEIVNFSGVAKFVDTPVKRYSSGMRVRLAFSVAAHLEPEILLVDEVLSVGDAAFQRKSLGKMEDVSKAGRTVILVSHNMASIESLSQKILWLNQGKIVRYSSDIEDGIRSYLRQNEQIAKSEDGMLDKNGIVTRVWCSGVDDEPTENVKIGDTINFHLTLNLQNALFSPRLRYILTNSRGVKVCTLDTRLQSVSMPDYLEPGIFEISCQIPEMALVNDTYYVSTVVYSRKKVIWEENNLLTLNVHPTDYYGTGRFPKMTHGVVAIKTDWKVEAKDPLSL